jgi:hypothetical protein
MRGFLNNSSLKAENLFYGTAFAETKLSPPILVQLLLLLFEVVLLLIMWL